MNTEKQVYKLNYKLYLTMKCKRKSEQKITLIKADFTLFLSFFLHAECDSICSLYLKIHSIMLKLETCFEF